MSITVAQIGCGYWGPNLLRALSANPRCRVKYVCDMSQPRRDYVSLLHPGVETVPDCDRVLNDRDIQAVVIATPVASHFSLAMAALEAGKHILVEKPMATSIEEVAAIRDLAKSKQLTVMAGHTFLYNKAVSYLKRLVDEGELGVIRYISCQRLNLGRIRQDVDALWNFAPHDVSIIQYLLSDPEPMAVTRIGMDYVQPGIEDVCFLHLIYPEKVMAQVHVSWLDPLKVRRMTVVGSKRMVVYDDVAENKIAIYDKGIDRMAVLGENMDFDPPCHNVFTYRSGDILLPKIEWIEPLQEEINHFLDCAENGVACRTGAEHALGVVRILKLASEAGQRNNPHA